MARIISFFKIIQNNWKKSLFGAIALSYGASYSIDVYETKQIMRQYCEEAVTFGDQILLPYCKPQHVTVILNPVAKKRKAKKLFEKYCEPLLHLAGFAVTIIQTQSENQARNLISNVNPETDIIVVAGGDGTLSDVVTGIIRHNNNNLSTAKQYSIGILPLGQTNRVANSLFPNSEYENLKEVRQLVDATMSIVRGHTKLADILEIKLLQKNVDHSVEPIYAVGAVEWGAWKDAQAKMDKYWYYGTFRRYATYIFSGFKRDLNWNCNGVIRYLDPCSGCSHCYKEIKESTISKKRWWSVFVPKIKVYSAGEKDIDCSKVVNENCGTVREITVSTTELNIITQNLNKLSNESQPLVKIELGPENIGYINFVTEGWRRVNGINKTLINKTLKAREIEIHPMKSDVNMNREYLFYIDNEEFELKPVKFKLLSKYIKVFCFNNSKDLNKNM